MASFLHMYSILTQSFVVFLYHVRIFQKFFYHVYLRISNENQLVKLHILLLVDKKIFVKITTVIYYYTITCDLCT
jgi:hypothetical protein